MRKRPSNVMIFLVGIVVLMTILAIYMRSDSPVSQYRYTDIVSLFQQNQVKDFVLDQDKKELRVYVLEGEAPPTTSGVPEGQQPESLFVPGLTENKRKAVITYRVPNLNLFINDTQSYVMTYNLEHPEDKIIGDVLPASEPSIWASLLPSLIIIGLLMLVTTNIMRQMGGSGGMGGSFGKARAKTAQEGRKVTFSDVAGAEEEKQELVEVVDFLRNPSKFNKLGARIPKGVMLIGPPGTGKTLLARAVAGEADVQFFSISGSDFVEMYVGVGASRVRDLFDQAKKASPSVIFIDEIDAVGRQRGAGLGGGHDEREQTLNQLLVEMDGFSTNTGVIVMAATNRSDILDPALLRPGRFDRQIMVGYPDVKGREEILKVHSRNKPLAPDVDLATIAKTTVGFTGADLENLMNEAALLAARKERKAITMEDIAESTIKVVAGPEKRSKVVSDDDKRLTAYHEGGHAVVSYHLPTQDPVHQVSIIPRGMAGGYTLNLPEADQSYATKRQMEEQLSVLMGGRVAEEIVLGDISTGASNDLERASKMAREMVTRYGFSKSIGPVVYGSDKNEVFLGRDYFNSSDVSEVVAAKIDEEVHNILTASYALSTTLINENRHQLELVAQYLLEYEKIEADEFQELMKNGEVTGKPIPNFVPHDAPEVDSASDSDQPETL